MHAELGGLRGVWAVHAGPLASGLRVFHRVVWVRGPDGLLYRGHANRHTLSARVLEHAMNRKHANRHTLSARVLEHLMNRKHTRRPKHTLAALVLERSMNRNTHSPP